MTGEKWLLVLLAAFILLMCFCAGKAKNKEKEMLAILVYSEAKDEPENAKVGIAAVVLNRKDNPNFPDSIEEVILQPNQFTSVEDGKLKYSADEIPEEDMEKCLAAVEAALDGEDPTDGALFYSWAYNESAVTEEFGKLIFFKEWLG